MNSNVRLTFIHRSLLLFSVFRFLVFSFLFIRQTYCLVNNRFHGTTLAVCIGVEHLLIFASMVLNSGMILKIVNLRVVPASRNVLQCIVICKLLKKRVLMKFYIRELCEWLLEWPLACMVLPALVGSHFSTLRCLSLAEYSHDVEHVFDFIVGCPTTLCLRKECFHMATPIG